MNYNGAALLRETLESLAQIRYPNRVTCVVDNASTDASIRDAQAFDGRAVILRQEVNRGGPGVNLGFDYLLKQKCDYILKLDNDVALEPSCVEQLVEDAGKRRIPALTSPVINYYRRDLGCWFQGGFIDWEHFETGHCASLEEFRKLPMRRRVMTGCGMWIPARILEAVGFYDERLFLYFDDTDFSVRAVRAGFEIDVVAGALMHHKVSASSGGVEARSPFKAYHGLRSSLLFWRRYSGWWRFHRQYCAGHLGKWVNGLGEEWRQPETQSRAQAVIDALWYFVSSKNRPTEHPPAPAWFRNAMVRRPWLVVELMAFRFGNLAGGLAGTRR